MIIAGAAIPPDHHGGAGIRERDHQQPQPAKRHPRRLPHADASAEGRFPPLRREESCPPAGTVLPASRKNISRHIAKLALELFDSARAIGLHDAPPVSRELLYYAALLHDIGIFISFANHNAHSHYLIRNTELLGFTEREIELIAALAFFHRKRPSKKIPLFLQLDEGIREEVRLLSLFLTLAERMDKSHRQIIRSARFGRTPDGELELCLRASEVCPIEIEEIGAATS